jgi:hypothetical protein
MSLARLDSNTFLNLDAIASVRFTGDDEMTSADVKFVGVSAAQQGCISETLSGEPARKLHEMLVGDSGESAAQIVSRKPTIPPSRPEFSRTKAWYYLPDADGRRYIMAYVNAKGSCSMRTFDADTGAFLSKKYQPGNYQTQFADFTQNAVELTVYSQPNLERDCKERLPETLLAHLKKQLK